MVCGCVLLSELRPRYSFDEMSLFFTENVGDFEIGETEAEAERGIEESIRYVRVSWLIFQA